jgi:hypothetical protein
MNRRRRGRDTTRPSNLYTVLTRSRSVSAEPFFPVSSEHVEESEIAMPLDTELISYLKGMEDRLTEKVNGIDSKLNSIIVRVEDVESRVKDLQQQVSDVEKKLLEQEVYNRKYNLMLYGLHGHENKSSETIDKLRTLARDKLQIPSLTVDKMLFRNAHRLQKRDDKPAPIIMVFLCWSDRMTFLEGARNLKRNDGLSIRTDLPPILKKRRGVLNSVGYDLRMREKVQTRVREKATNLWLETRKNSSLPWMKRVVSEDGVPF